MLKGRRRKGWRALDIPGLLGCALVIGFTYALFWYYGASVRGEDLLPHLF